MLNINLSVYPGKTENSKDSLLIKFLMNDDRPGIEKFVNSFSPYFSMEEIDKLIEKGGTVQRKVYGNGDFDEACLNIVKKGKSFNPDYFRNFLAGAIGGLETNGAKNAVVSPVEYSLIKDVFISEQDYLNSIAEGILYAGYKFRKYKTDEKPDKDLNVFIDYRFADLAGIIDDRKRLISAIKFTRNLQNEPGNTIYPDSLADMIKQEFAGTEVKVTVYDEKKIAEEKMGGLLAVGKGSANSPRFIIMEYKPKGDKPVDVALVGKGITFDSGGISIKPAADMWLMKADMSGAAVTAGIILAAAKNKLKVNITGVIAAAENMPSGNALKPGDIVTTSSGKTIEVDNTDAEGRIVLADALHYASNLNPGCIIDFATLTGAVVVALGEFTAGILSNNDDLAAKLIKSSKVTHERIWQLPLWDDFNKQIESEVADVKNLGGKWGGAITAAKFLEKWVDEKNAWAHLDIAGPSMPNKFTNYSSTYMTGFGVRLVYDFICREFS